MRPPATAQTGRGAARAGGFAVAAALMLLFAAPAAVLILNNYDAGRAANDQNAFHLPTLRAFARQFPRFDLSDYRSATSPGYHLVMAMVDRAVGDDVQLLRIVSATFALGLLATLGVAVAMRVPAWTAFWLCLPIVYSLYVFGAGAWLLPDDAAWWGVLAVLLVALRARMSARTYLLAAVLLAVVAFVRQNQIWLAAVLWLAAWLEPVSPPSASSGRSTASGRLRRVMLMVAATLPAFLLLAWLFCLWRGFVPPAFQRNASAPADVPVNQGLSPAAPLMATAMLGVFGTFYLGYLLPHAWPLLRQSPHARRVVGASTLAALLIGLLPRSDYDMSAGRWSGLWNVAKRLPTIAHRSPLVVALTVLGAFILSLCWLTLGPRDRRILIFAWLIFAAAQVVSATAYVRYYEPFALILLPLACSRSTAQAAAPSSAAPPYAFIGPLLLALLLGVVTVLSLRA